MPPSPPPRNKKPNAPAAEPPLAERIYSALLGLWLGDVMGVAVAHKHFRLPEFPFMYEKPEEMACSPLHRGGYRHSLALGFAACGAYCLSTSRYFHLPSFLQTYGQYAACLQQAGLAYFPGFEGVDNIPPENGSTSSPVQEGDGAPAVPLEPALARTLLELPRFRSPYGLLEKNIRVPAPAPVLDGVLLRCVPLACFFCADTEARMGAVAEEALATSTGALGALAAVALAALLSHAICSPQPFAPASELLENMHIALVEAAPLLANKGLSVTAIQQATAALHEDISFAQQNCPNLYAPELNLRRHAGHLRTSFRLALWEFFHAPETAPQNALEDVVRRGGNPAAQGALVAALCGARWGGVGLPNSGVQAFASPVALPALPPQFQPFSLASLSQTMAQKIRQGLL